MSSILDALERAAKEREKAQGAAATANFGADSARERRMKEELEASRRRTRIASAIAAVVLLLGGTAVAVIALRDDKAPPPQSDRTAVLPPVDPAPAAILPTPTPWPSPTAPPSPTPFPSPTAIPTAAATPRVKPTPSPLSEATDDPSSLFTDGQIVRPVDLGWMIEGTMKFSNSSYVIINGEQVRAGQKYQDFHVLEVHERYLLVDLGKGVTVRVIF